MATWKGFVMLRVLSGNQDVVSFLHSTHCCHPAVVLVSHAIPAIQLIGLVDGLLWVLPMVNNCREQLVFVDIFVGLTQ
jgi:hypothetical protein